MSVEGAPLTALDHRPVFFPAAGETVFGIFTAAPQPNGRAVLILSGGLHGTSTVGRNRIFLRLTSRLVADGFHVMRFDYHGIGESTGRAVSFGSDEPFKDDAVGAIRWMQGQGITDFVLVGKCFGARMAWASAAEVEGLDAVVAVDSPMRHYGKQERTITGQAERSLAELTGRALRLRTMGGLVDPKRRAAYRRITRAKARQLVDRLPGGSARRADAALDGVSRRLVSSVEALVDRRVPVLFLYGTDDRGYREFEAAREGRLGQLIDEAGTAVEVRTIAGEVEGFAYVDIQDALIDAIADWLHRLQ